MHQVRNANFVEMEHTKINHSPAAASHVELLAISPHRQGAQAALTVNSSVTQETTTATRQPNAPQSPAALPVPVIRTSKGTAPTVPICVTWVIVYTGLVSSLLSYPVSVIRDTLALDVKSD